MIRQQREENARIEAARIAAAAEEERHHYEE
jgi:hypothetical protein